MTEKKYTVKEIIDELHSQGVYFYLVGNYDLKHDEAVFGLEHSFSENKKYLDDLKILYVIRSKVLKFVQLERKYDFNVPRLSPVEKHLLSIAIEPNYPWRLEGVFYGVGLTAVKELIEWWDEYEATVGTYKRKRNTFKKFNKQKVFERDCWKCVVCKKEGYLEVDHITPLFDGGTNDLENLQCLCTECHKKKTITEAKARKKNK